MIKLSFKRRTDQSKFIHIKILFFSILFSLFITGLLFYASGFNPFYVYKEIIRGAFFSKHALTEVIVKTSPLILCSLSVCFAAIMMLWNIGAEGQLYIGAFFASFIALKLEWIPSELKLPLMFLAGFCGGALWALIPALLKIISNVNDIISTLLLNYIAILFVNYFIYGPWKGKDGFPYTHFFPGDCHLPLFFDSRIHLGVFLSLIIAVIVYIVINKTTFGYEMKIIGCNKEAALYAGMDITKNIVIVMLISGGIAGICGMFEVSGIIHRLQPDISSSYGYTGIIIAWLCKRKIGLIILVSFLFGAMEVGGDAMQITMHIPAAIVRIFEAALLFSILGLEIFSNYILTFQRENR
ncbi:MAG: ABC transporter permease [Candidatus Hydrogenedentota bacterium]